MARIAIPQRRFHNHYLWLLEQTSDRDATIQLQAGWSTRSWTQLLGCLLTDLNDLKFVQKLGLCSRADNDETRRMQEEDTDLWFSLTLRSASQRAWSMLAEYDIAPANWSGIFHSDPSIAADALSQCMLDKRAVEAAFTASNDAQHAEREAPGFLC